MSEMTQVLGTVAMEPKGNYDADTYYEKLNTVLYNDSTYMAKEPVQGEDPSTSSKWQLIGGGVRREDIVDNLDSNDATKMLSAKQGKVLNEGKVQVFDTVALMKTATLKNGMTVQTLGYYAVNDGGGSTYKIRTKTNEDVVDDSIILSLNDVSIIAELIAENEMNFLQFGAKLNNNDDSLPIQKAILFAEDKNIKLNGLGNEYIVSNYTTVDSNYGILIDKSIEIDNFKLKLKNSCPDMSTVLLIKLTNANDSVCLTNFSIDGNKTNQAAHITPSQDGGRHGIRMYGIGNIHIKNAIIHDCYTDNLLLREGSCSAFVENVSIYNAGRNGITNNAYNGYFSNINIYDNGTISSPKSGFHVEPDGENTINNLIIKNMIINNSTSVDFKIHNNNAGHIIRNIDINNLNCDSFDIANYDPSNNNKPNFINKLLIENSEIGKILFGPVTTTQYAGVKEIIINNSTVAGIEIKNVLINKILANNTKFPVTINFLNKVDLYINNCVFDRDTYEESDAQARVGIMALDTGELNNVIIENSSFINNSRGIRAVKANNITIKNCIFHTYTNNINITTITNSLLLTNNRSLGGSNFVGGTSGNIVSMGNDLRPLSSLYSAGYTVEESANLVTT